MLIDANVWSELSRPRPEEAVLEFLATHRRSLVLSTIVLAEIEFGIAQANDTRQKERLGEWLGDVFTLCEDRILTPDLAAAAIWGKLKAELKATGKIIADFDLLIAAQAIAEGLPLVTRNLSDMTRTGATIINPWPAG